MQILIGADPEVFVKNAAGEFRSAWGMIPGTKKAPFKVPKGAVQVDGNALEFNIDPAATKAEFVGNIREVYQEMGRMVPGYNLAIEPVAMFDKAYFDALPEGARELGCDPDFNAWTRQVNERPFTNEPFRTAAGHIHIGWLPPEAYADPMDSNHFDDCCEVAKQMDYFLGMWSLTWDKDSERRRLYGSAGCFRPKPYGCEYRSLSNAWLKTEELQGWVYDAAIAGMKALEKGQLMSVEQGQVAQVAIDEGHYGWNREWSDHTHLTMPPGGYWGKEKKVA